VALEVTNGDPPLRLEIPEWTPPVLKVAMQMCFTTEAQKRPDFKTVSNLFSQARLEEWQPDFSPKAPTNYGNSPESGSTTSISSTSATNLVPMNHYGNVPSVDSNNTSKGLLRTDSGNKNYGNFPAMTSLSTTINATKKEITVSHYGGVPSSPSMTDVNDSKNSDDKRLSISINSYQNNDSNGVASVTQEPQKNNYGSINLGDRKPSIVDDRQPDLKNGVATDDTLNQQQQQQPNPGVYKGTEYGAMPK